MEIVSLMKFNKSKTSKVSMAKKGDKEAFASLIDEHKLIMYRVAKGILKNEVDVEDSIQNTIIKAYENISYLRKDEYFKTWLIRILINESNAILKANKKVVSLDEVAEVGLTTDDSKLEIEEAVERLNEDLKITVKLFYFEDLKQKDIAVILGVPEGTVRSRLSRARSILHDMIGER